MQAAEMEKRKRRRVLKGQAETGELADPCQVHEAKGQVVTGSVDFPSFLSPSSSSSTPSLHPQAAPGSCVTVYARIPIVL